MKDSTYKISGNDLLAPGVHSMLLEGDCGEMVIPGQFVQLSLEGFFLRRPISICDASNGNLRLVYKEVGKGTKALGQMDPGSTLEIIAPLGNGFDTSLCSRKALLVGGGLGAAPLLYLAKTLLAQGKEVEVILGFNTADEIFLVDEMKYLGCKVRACTMDGSVGVKGFVTDALAGITFDVFYSCGPKPMMAALCKALPSAKGQVSMEERMGCGFGICYGCTIITAKGPRRVCADGPVFDKDDIIWQ